MNSTIDAAVYRSDGIRVYGLDAELEKKVCAFLCLFYITYFQILFSHTTYTDYIVYKRNKCKFEINK